MKNKAFTLIELLVVVLIIGILAAIAVPKYQKAIAKSRATQLQTMISSLVSASKEYYLATGQRPTKFSDLSITLPLEKAQTNSCDLATSSKEATMQGDDFEIILNMDSNNDGNRFEIITGMFNKGEYKCTGFSYFFMADKNVPIERLSCAELVSNFYRGTKNKRGDFCEKVMGKTFYSHQYGVVYFI